MKNITIITHANAIITLKNDQVQSVNGVNTLCTSVSEKFIHVDDTETWLNNINNNANILINY